MLTYLGMALCYLHSVYKSKYSKIVIHNDTLFYTNHRSLKLMLSQCVQCHTLSFSLDPCLICLHVIVFLYWFILSFLTLHFSLRHSRKQLPVSCVTFCRTIVHLRILSQVSKCIIAWRQYQRKLHITF